MKITVLSTAYPLRGGISHFNGLLYKELIKKNEVNVVTFSRQYPALLFPGKSQLEEENEIEKIPSEQIVDSINPLNWLKIGHRIRKEEPELLIFKYWMPFFAPCFGTISRIVKRNRKTKILVICDNVISHEPKPAEISITKYFFNNADCFILLSEKVKADLLKIKPKAIYKVLPHPIYSNFGNPVPKAEAKKRLNIMDDKLILFFGFIRDYKGLDVLLNAMPELKEKINVKLAVAGEFYGGKEKYLGLIDKLNLKDDVYLFTDFIPTSEVKYYFSASDIVILPYKDATQSGIVQIAMNFKKPVVASDAGGISEVVLDGKTGFLVEKENPSRLAAAVIKFYDEKKEEEFVHNIEIEAKKYSWEKFAAGLIELASGNQHYV
jgi:glycosyltransferase involved in cell wall biosynthesis